MKERSIVRHGRNLPMHGDQHRAAYMNRERTNLWVAKTLPLLRALAPQIGAPPFPGRDAEIEQIDAWIDLVTTRIGEWINERETLATTIESLESYNFFSDGSGRSEVAATPIDGVWLARAAVIRVVRPSE